MLPTALHHPPFPPTPRLIDQIAWFSGLVRLFEWRATVRVPNEWLEAYVGGQLRSGQVRVCFYARVCGVSVCILAVECDIGAVCTLFAVIDS